MKELQERKTKCHFCESDKVPLHIEDYSDVSKTYKLFHCNVCGTEWWEPLKNPGAEWYENDRRYAHRNIDPILKPNEKHINTVAFFGKKTGRVLDVGCGVGNFLALAQGKGWKCWGIDFDRDSIKTAHETFGLENVEAADLTTFTKNHLDIQFDLVTFFDVFEHIDNHTDFMAEIRLLLKSDGHIALSVPYRRGWRWLMPHDLPPRHLTRWDDVSICKFLNRHGFMVQKIWKEAVSWEFLVMKIRWKYGRFATFGLVKAAKEKAYKDVLEKTGRKIIPARRPAIKLLHIFAKAKDFILFGIPAAVLWIGLRFTDKRHTDFYLIAQKYD